MPPIVRRCFLLSALVAACGTRPELQTPAAVERLFVLDGGGHHTTDVSSWSPGVNQGQPWDFGNHCYLIRHRRGLLLWDTGFADEIAALPDGLLLGDGTVRVRVKRTLAAQLQEIGVTPDQVTHLSFSHFHMDHTGNANRFTRATLFLQQTEHDAAFGRTPQRFGFQPALYGRLRESAKVLLHGDHDVFGDGSVVILSTPGHTPGHQSLLVRLPRSGPVILSGDLAHFRANWDARRVPATNFDRGQSVDSMARIAERMAATGARLWINHDLGPGDGARLAPAFVE